MLAMVAAIVPEGIQARRDEPLIWNAATSLQVRSVPPEPCGY
jgi:hypothetical protein